MILPRGLVFITTCWIFGAWCLCIGIRPPIQPSIASYLPGIRLFISAMSVGLCVAWPMLRLSERPTQAPIRQVMIDFLTIAVLVHVVLWPLRLATNWSISRMGLIDLFIFAWGLLIAAILALTTGSRMALERVAAMILIVMISLMGPIAYFVCLRMNWQTPPLWLDGPILGVLRDTLGGGLNPDSLSWNSTYGVCIAAAAAWLVVILLGVTASKPLKNASLNHG